MQENIEEQMKQLKKEETIILELIREEEKSIKRNGQIMIPEDNEFLPVKQERQEQN